MRSKLYVFSDRVYEVMPYFYLGAGVFTISLLPNAMGVFSGLTLMSAAGVVWGLRYQNRRSFQQSKDGLAAPHMPSAQPAAKKLVEVSWNSSYECGHPIIDAQHRRLFGISNELVVAVLSRKSKIAVAVLLDELVEQIANHFVSEEAILAGIKHVEYAQHCEHHRSLSERLAALREGHRHDKVSVSELVTFVFHDVIIKHIITQDLNFSETLKAVAQDKTSA